jgi:hypothetical protein
MSHAIDFVELKQQVSIERAAEMLGIRLKRTGPNSEAHAPSARIAAIGSS